MSSTIFIYFASAIVLNSVFGVQRSAFVEVILVQIRKVEYGRGKTNYTPTKGWAFKKV